MSRKVTKNHTSYTISDELDGKKVSIELITHPNGTVSIRPGDGKGWFEFKKSKPALVELIMNLIDTALDTAAEEGQG